jgi:hypothetical protein
MIGKETVWSSGHRRANLSFRLQLADLINSYNPFNTTLSLEDNSKPPFNSVARRRNPYTIPELGTPVVYGYFTDFAPTLCRINTFGYVRRYSSTYSRSR